ncbi:MAG: hypothetical protein WAV56_04785 [Microgenomates group bacterium]
MFKNIAIALLVAILVIVAWNPVIAPAGRMIGRVASAAWNAAWNDETPAPAVVATPEDVKPPTVANDATPAPVAAAPDPVVTAPKGECKKDALTASHDDNLEAGRYEMSYFGGTSEACYMFGEFNFGVADQTWLVIVPPGWTLNLAGFVGETMWYRDSEGAVAWSITDSTANLTRPDGRNEKTPIVVWVNNPDDLKLLQEVAEEYEVIPPAK